MELEIGEHDPFEVVC